MQPVAAPAGLDDARALFMQFARPVAKWPAARPLFLGIDPSLTNTGVAVLYRGRIHTFTMSPPKEVGLGVARLAWFRAEFRRLFTLLQPHTIAIEGYAFGASNKREALGELGGVLRLAAHDCRLRVVIITPNGLKMFATGKGKCGKDLVTKEVFKRWGIDVDDDNQADAGALSLVAHAATLKVEGLTAPQRAALTKVAAMA